MSRSNGHILALLPLFTILSLAPSQLPSKVVSRGIASDEAASAFPKYEARAAKIEKDDLLIDEELDLSSFSKQLKTYQMRLAKEKQNYKVDLTDKERVDIQRSRVKSLVLGLVEIEESKKALLEKKGLSEKSQELADKKILDLKTSLEELLRDESDNQVLVLQDKLNSLKEKSEDVVVTKVKEEEEKHTCELSDQSKTLGKQVEELVSQQKVITESLLAMNSMMIQMAQQQQLQQASRIPHWLTEGSMLSYQERYPSHMQTPIIIYSSPQREPTIFPSTDFGYNSIQQNPQLGEQTYLQYSQSNQYQQLRPMMYDSHYNVQQPIMPGNFSTLPYTSSYNFSS